MYKTSSQWLDLVSSNGQSLSSFKLGLVVTLTKPIIGLFENDICLQFLEIVVFKNLWMSTIILSYEYLKQPFKSNGRGLKTNEWHPWGSSLHEFLLSQHGWMPLPNKTILFSNHGCISFIHIHQHPYTYPHSFVSMVLVTHFIHPHSSVSILHVLYMEPMGSALHKDNPQRRTSILDSNDGFWNEVLENELPNYKDPLWIIHVHLALKLVNANISSRLHFNNLQNCPITINYVVCSKLFFMLWHLNIGKISSTNLIFFSYKLEIFNLILICILQFFC